MPGPARAAWWTASVLLATKLPFTCSFRWLVCEEICIPEEARFSLLPHRHYRIDQHSAHDFIDCILENQDNVKQACLECSAESRFGLCDGL